MINSNATKKMISLLVVILLIICVCGCDGKEQYSDYNFYAVIKSTYKDNYDNKLFQLSDFEYDNIDHFSYTIWSDKDNIGYLCIYLKKTGKKEIEKAMKHFSALDFVEKCEKVPIMYIVDDNN